MTDELKEILEKVSQKKISTEDAYDQIKKNSLINVNDLVQFDVNRDKRTGIPEVVYAGKKSVKVCIEIIEKVLPKKNILLFTRLTDKHITAFKEYFDQNPTFNVELDEDSRLAIISNSTYRFPSKLKGLVGIITAGTSDISVAREAEAVLKLMGIRTISFYDIGVAGLHRLFEPLNILNKEDADVLIVFAGMEGALPSVVSGLVDIPVIAVPVSVGYGVKSPGEVALYSMLTSCSPGMAVVNIDAGFNAGAIAGLISLRSEKKRL